MTFNISNIKASITPSNIDKTAVEIHQLFQKYQQANGQDKTEILASIICLAHKQKANDASLPVEIKDIVIAGKNLLNFVEEREKSGDRGFTLTQTDKDKLHVIDQNHLMSASLIHKLLPNKPIRFVLIPLLLPNGEISDIASSHLTTDPVEKEIQEITDNTFKQILQHYQEDAHGILHRKGNSSSAGYEAQSLRKTIAIAARHLIAHPESSVEQEFANIKIIAMKVPNEKRLFIISTEGEIRLGKHPSNVYSQRSLSDNQHVVTKKPKIEEAEID